jgi:hypothetical protein
MFKLGLRFHLKHVGIDARKYHNEHCYALEGYIQKFSDWTYNEIYAYNNKHLLRSNTKGYGSNTH